MRPPGAVDAKVYVAKPFAKRKTFADPYAFELKYNPDNQTQFDAKGVPLDAVSNPYFLIEQQGPRLHADGCRRGQRRARGEQERQALALLRAVRRHHGRLRDGRPQNSRCGPELRPDAHRHRLRPRRQPLHLGPDRTGTGRGPGVRGEQERQAAQDPHRVQQRDGRRGRSRRLRLRLRPPAGGTGGGARRAPPRHRSRRRGTPPKPRRTRSTRRRSVRSSRSRRTATEPYAQVTMPAGLLFTGGKLYASTWAVAAQVADPVPGRSSRSTRAPSSAK